MTDKLSIAETTTGVVVKGMDVAQGFYKIADAIGATGNDIRVFATEISSLSKVLSLTREKMLRPKGGAIEELSLFMDLSDICDQILTPLKCTQETLGSLLSQQSIPKKANQAGIWISGYFLEKPKLLFYREAVKGQQQNLDALLAAMTYDAVKDLMHQMALENTLMAGRGAMDRFQGDTIRLYSQLGAKAPLLLMSPGNLEGGADAGVIPGPSSQDLPALNRDAFGGLGASPRPANDDSDVITEAELQSVDAIIEEHLDSDGTLSLNLYEDIRVTSRKTNRYAERVLETMTEEDVPSYFEATLTAAPSVPITGTSQLTAISSVAISGPCQQMTVPRRQIVSVGDSFSKYHDLDFDQVKTWEGMLLALLDLYSDTGAAVQGWRADLTKEAQLALGSGKYVLRDSSNAKEVAPRFWERTVKPGKRFWLKFRENQLLNMNNEQLHQLDLRRELERSKPSRLNRYF